MEFLSFLRKKKKIGLALSGGGMRGIAHIATLKALEEYGLKPDMLSGTSAGAIVGAFYALGKTPDEMMEIVRTKQFFSRSSFRFSRKGIFNPDFLLKIFKEYFPENDFSCLKLPFYVATTELTEGKIEYFSDGNLYEILLATSAVPFIFPPVIMNGKFYVDGGVLNNMPTEPIQNQCDFLIGSHVNALGYESLKNITPSTEFDRILHLAISGSVYTKSSTCDIFINPPNMLKYSLFKKESAKIIFENVYHYTSEKLETLGYRKFKA